MEILLTQNKMTYVDDNLYDKIMKQGKWYAKCNRNGDFYAMTNIYKDGKRTTLQMHGYIYELKNGPILKGMDIDHDNGNSLDNYSLNLIARTPREHRIKHNQLKAHSSQYTGVYWDKRVGKWRACIEVEGKTRHIGSYVSELHAYEAYQAILALIV